MAGIEKLALCSKILYDHEILEQRRLIEKLRLELFWERHNHCRFTSGIYLRNSRVQRCECSRCHSEVESETDDVEDEECKFLPIFQAKLNELELSVDEDDGKHVNHPYLARDCASEKDVDFVHSEDWKVITFGKRLWSCEKANHPNLVRYEKLFDWLFSNEPE